MMDAKTLLVACVLAAFIAIIIGQWPHRAPQNSVMGWRRLDHLNSTPEVGILSVQPRVEIWRSFLGPDELARVLEQRDHARSHELRRDSFRFEFLNLNDNAPFGKELSTGTLSVAGDAMFEEIEARIGAWTGAGRHAHEVDLMLTFSQSDGPNARTGDYLRYNPRIDDLHVDTSGDYLNCATVLIFLSDGPADGGTVFPCLRSVDRARSEQGADDAMAATCRAAGEELLAQPSFDPSVPKRDSVRFTKWGRERQTGKPLSPALRSVWDAATSACDGDGSALRVTPEAGMALLWQHRDCDRPTWAADLAAGDISGSDYRTFHARCLHETGMRATLQKFKRPRMQALLEHTSGTEQAKPDEHERARER